MTRPLRIEFPGALYHVTSRGDRGEPIFANDDDRRQFLNVLAEAVARFDAEVLGFCLMGNHYHAVVRTRQGNLSRLMRQVNGVYSQSFNRRHRLTGHLFQGRFHSVVVDRNAYLAEVCRYVELNPVRAGLVDVPSDWPWSSYRAHVGLDAVPAWLDTIGLHGYMLGRDAICDDDTRRAQEMYAALVAEGAGDCLWKRGLRQEIYLGDEAFIEEVQARISREQAATPEIPRAQRRKPTTLAQWIASDTSRTEILRRAHAQGGLTMTEMARELNRSIAWVSRLIGRSRQSAATKGNDDSSAGGEDESQV
jgi:REP element-mobilizing transposase RayT